MNKLTIKKITKMAQKNGLQISVGHPSKWGIPCSLKRAYSFSVLNNGLWDIPETVDAYNLSQLLNNINDMIDARGD